MFDISTFIFCIFLKYVIIIDLQYYMLKNSLLDRIF